MACGEMIFIENFKFQNTKIFISFYYIFFKCYFCSRNLKRQSEHSVLFLFFSRPGLKYFVLISYLCFLLLDLCVYDSFMTFFVPRFHLFYCVFGNKVIYNQKEAKILPAMNLNRSLIGTNSKLRQNCSYQGEALNVPTAF